MSMCYHPWVGLDISPQGEFKPCCKYTDVLAKDINEYESSLALDQLRQDFLAGKKPDGCNRCWQDEAAGLPSKRTLDNQYIFNNKPPNLKSLKALSMPFGNTCNLACRTCSSYSSSRWRQEAQNLRDKFPEIRIFGHNKFYRDSDYMQSIKDRTHDVVHVDFPGGEPFYSDGGVHSDFLVHLAQHNPENISLHYTTNGTKMPTREIKELWELFKSVEVQISIDGVTDHFEYNRWPAQWITFLLNMSKWQELRLANKNIRLSVSHTVSIFTIWNLPEFMDWCYRMNLPEPYLGLVSNPKHYSITVFPEESKHKIENKLKDYPKLQPIVRAMWAKDDSELLDTTIKYVKILDKQREQNFQQTFPETYQLLGERCQTLYQLY